MVYEIGDEEEKKATQYSLKMGIKKDMADKIVNCVGARLVYLQSSIKFADSISSVSDVCNSIKEQFFSTLLTGQKEYILHTRLQSMTMTSTYVHMDLIATINATILNFGGACV